MSFTITFTGKVAEELATLAQSQRLSIEQVVAGLLGLGPPCAVAAHDPTPEQVVARIVATPPNPRAKRPAEQSLADALRDAPTECPFDPAQWDRQWAAVESEMKATTRANDAAEGRR